MVSLSEGIHQKLREEILDLKLAPGVPLSEVDLSARFGASRTPVREALWRLRGDGLVTMHPGRGAFVAEVSLREVAELFQLREALECFIVRRAAQSTDRAKFIEIANEMALTPELIEQGDADSYYELVSRMDETFLSVGGNSRIRLVLEDTWRQIHRARHLAAADPVRLAEGSREHLAILEAVVKGDPEAAQLACSQHLGNSLNHILRSALKTAGVR